MFLNPDAADAAVQDLAREHGDVLMLGTSLRKRLKDRGLLRAVEMRGTEPRLLVRKTIAGVRHEGVMHLHTDTLWPASLSSTEPAQSAQSDAGGCETKSSDGPPLSEAWPNPGPVDSETGPIPTASGDAEPVAPKREATGATQAGLGRHGSLGGQPDIDEGMPEQPRRRRRAAKAGGA